MDPLPGLKEKLWQDEELHQRHLKMYFWLAEGSRYLYGIPFWESPQKGFQNFGVCVGVLPFMETTIYLGPFHRQTLNPTVAHRIQALEAFGGRRAKVRPSAACLLLRLPGPHQGELRAFQAHGVWGLRFKI